METKQPVHVTIEPFGVRLQCGCGQEQCYSGIDEYIYQCTACTCAYLLARTPEGIQITVLERRTR